MNLNNL